MPTVHSWCVRAVRELLAVAPGHGTEAESPQERQGPLRGPCRFEDLERMARSPPPGGGEAPNSSLFYGTGSLELYGAEAMVHPAFFIEAFVVAFFDDAAVFEDQD